MNYATKRDDTGRLTSSDPAISSALARLHAAREAYLTDRLATVARLGVVHDTGDAALALSLARSWREGT